MANKSKRDTRSYYLSEEAIKKVLTLAERLDMPASSVIEHMIQTVAPSGWASSQGPEVQDLEWVKAATGGIEPAELIVYHLALPPYADQLHGTSWGVTIPSDKGPIGVLVRMDTA